VHATQFFEFLNTLVFETSDGTTVRLPSTRLQPIASADVSTGTPLRGIRSFAGPDVFPLDELGRLTLAAQHDNRTVITDDKAGTFAGVTGDVLTAGRTHIWHRRTTRTGSTRLGTSEQAVQNGMF
jgi:hypothetical protein